MMTALQKIVSFTFSFMINSVFFTINFVLGLILLITMLVYRIIATILIKLEYKEAVFLNSVDSILATGKTPDENLLLYSFLCSGAVDIESFRSIIMEKIKHRERLFCFLKEKYGYFFWLKEENFNIDEHVLYHPNLTIKTKAQWEKVQYNLYYETVINKNISPWSIHIVPLQSDYEEGNGTSQFYIVPIWSHCIADGYSVFYTFIQSIADNEEPKLMLPKSPTPSFLKKVVIILQGLFFIPYFMTDYLMFKPDVFIRNGKLDKQICADLGIVKTETLKIVKQAAKMPSFVVLIACMMGALEKYFLKSKLSMPHQITVSVPHVLWRPEDEVVLTNNFVLAYLTLPFNHNTGIDRLEEIYKIVRSAHTQNRYMVNYCIMNILGYITPLYIHRWTHSHDDNSVMLSIAALKSFPYSILEGRRVTSFKAKRMLSLMGNVKIIFHPVTFGEDITLSVHSNSTVVSKEELQEMVKDFQEEFEILKENIEEQPNNSGKHVKVE